MRSILKAAKGQGLVPYGLTGEGEPEIQNSEITFGAMGDSYYEYLLKMWVQTGKTEPEWKDAWKRAMTEMKNKLITKTQGGLTYIAELSSFEKVHKMEHLTCFAAGMLMYGARELPKEEVDPDWEPLAAAVTETCYQMYHRQASHLGPECVMMEPSEDSGNDRVPCPSADRLDRCLHTLKHSVQLLWRNSVHT